MRPVVRMSRKDIVLLMHIVGMVANMGNKNILFVTLVAMGCATQFYAY